MLVDLPAGRCTTRSGAPRPACPTSRSARASGPIPSTGPGPTARDPAPRGGARGAGSRAVGPGPVDGIGPEARALLEVGQAGRGAPERVVHRPAGRSTSIALADRAADDLADQQVHHA